MNIEQKLDKEISTIISFSMANPLAKREPKRRKELTYSEFLSDKMMMISLIRTGVPYSLFELIKAVTPFSEGDWASLLSISTKSLVRYKQESKSFKPLQSEKILEMAEVAQAGIETFGEVERFRLWLDTPNYSLGNLKPMELLRDSYGKEMVIAALTRIDHGIFV